MILSNLIPLPTLMIDDVICSGASYTLEDALRQSGNKSVFTVEKEHLVAIETASDIAPGRKQLYQTHQGRPTGGGEVTDTNTPLSSY